MSDIDKLQNAAEQIGQMEDEQRRKAKKERDELFNAPPVKDTASAEDRLDRIPVEKIDTSGNLRTGGLPDVDEMALSIKERGLQVPIGVRELPEPRGEFDYELIEGGRRIAGWKIVNPEKPIPALIKTGIDDTERYELMFTAMANFRDWTPLEKARAFKFLLDRNDGMTASELARSLGVSSTTASSYLRALDLPETVLAQVEAGNLSFTIAELIQRGAETGKYAVEEVEEIAGKVVAGDMTPGEVRDTVLPEKPKKEVDPLKDGDDSGVDFGAKVWDPQNDALEESERLERLADEMLAKENAAQGGNPATGDGDLPWDEDGAAAPTPAKTDESAVDSAQKRKLESYLLGRLLRELAPADYLEEIGVDHDLAYEWAYKLNPRERTTHLHALAEVLVEEDANAPSEIFG